MPSAAYYVALCNIHFEQHFHGRLKRKDIYLFFIVLYLLFVFLCTFPAYFECCILMQILHTNL